MTHQGLFNFESRHHWTEEETQLLQQQIHEAFPYGLYRGEPPLLWQRVAARMTRVQIRTGSYTADGCRMQYFIHIEPRFCALNPPWQVCERPWSERESDTLRNFIHHTLPGGLYKTGLMIWKEIGERMTQAALDLWLPFRMYGDNCLREHYFRQIRPRFVDTNGASIPASVLAANTTFDPPWSNAEHNLLRMNMHFTMPGGLYDAALIFWPEISRNMMKDAPKLRIPYRLYNDSNVRSQYFNYIRPCFVPSTADVDMKDGDTPRASDAYMKDEDTPRANYAF